MTSVESKEFRSYCDTVYRELSEMKSRLLGFVKQIEGMKGPEKEALKAHAAHFQDIINTIDWKLEILTRVCPFEWTGYTGVERTASVPADQALSQQELVGAGSVGG